MPSIIDIAEVYQGLARSGRGAGTRRGQWPLHLVESSHVQEDGWLNLCDLREIELVRSRRTERHLLRPFDVLITARTGTIQLALVPPQVSTTVAGVTLLVVRPNSPECGMGHFLWYYLTSSHGRSELIKRLSTNKTITTLSASAVGEVVIPMPSPHQLSQVVRLVEYSEEAYASAIKASVIRRGTIRDSIIEQFISQNTSQRD